MTSLKKFFSSLVIPPESPANQFDDTASESDGLIDDDLFKKESSTTNGDKAPLLSHFNHQVRPLLDAIDRLRMLDVMKEGIQLPTIVVVGDQSSGKSSVLESLAEISLPRSTGICTRVPLIMRLQNNKSRTPEIFLEYKDKKVPVEESHIPEAINLATDEIAGDGKGIANTPLTLVVKRRGVPDLTMVDLPGITRVPVHGQPDDIYEQIKGIIMEYIKPEASIILNVLSATVDFSTCESIRMSQMVDKRGDRTLAVVTKADRGPQELAEKVNADDVNMGLGYVCVKNRIGDETYKEARKEERRLFKTDPHLSKIDESMVGIPVLATRLVEIQERIIAKCLPGIMKCIITKLNGNLSQLEKLPKALMTVSDAVSAFLKIIGSAKESLGKLLVRGEFDEYPDDSAMHGTTRLAELLNKFSVHLHNTEKSAETKDFLVAEIQALEECKGIELPNFLPRRAFLRILQSKVDKISDIPIKFAEKMWDYIEQVVSAILLRHSETYYQLKISTERAAHQIVENRRQKSLNRVKEIILMEKLTDYTCNPDYRTTWHQLLRLQNKFLVGVYPLEEGEEKKEKRSRVNLGEFGDVKIDHLWEYSTVLLQEAFDLKMRLTAYWRIVLGRIVDSMALHLQLSINDLLNDGIDDIVKEVMEPDGQGIARMLEESPAIARKRDKLIKSIKLLTESEEVVSKVMIRISGNDVI